MPIIWPDSSSRILPVRISASPSPPVTLNLREDTLLLGVLLYPPRAEAAEVPYFLLDESSYTAGADMEVSLFHYDVSESGVLAEIIWSDITSAKDVWYSPTLQVSLPVIRFRIFAASARVTV